jgi:signal transduction histidine kinase
MIERHLQLQRLEQPDIVLMRTQASVEDCLAQVRTEVVEVWPETPVRIQVLPGAPQRVLIDVELVVRALTNLVSNAAKAAPPGTPVTIDAVGDGAGGVGFLVADQGPGLGDVPVETLFSMHWRRTPHGSQPGANPWPEGFGIGLPMVHRIATLHQGRVTYRRLPPGFSEFAVWLPAYWGLSTPDPARVSVSN